LDRIGPSFFLRKFVVNDRIPLGELATVDASQNVARLVVRSAAKIVDDSRRIVVRRGHRREPTMPFG
jgi:hypothetical protein